MKGIGIALLALGAAVMVWGFTYDARVRPSDDEAYWQLVHAKIEERADPSIEPARIKDIQAGVYNPERAQTRQLIFAGGGVLILLGGIFTAAGYRARKE